MGTIVDSNSDVESVDDQLVSFEIHKQKANEVIQTIADYIDENSIT
jgi:hypothetical protein